MAPRRKPRDEARRARTGVYRQHICEAAEQVFAERGFAQAKLQDISRLAGLSMGTIYAIFPSKTALYRAILEERGQEVLQLVREVARRKAPPAETLDALITLYVDYFLAHPGFLRMHLRAGTSWAIAPSGTEAQVEHWRDIHALQADVFRRGVSAGVFVDEDPAYLARLFSAMDQVLLADWVAGGMKADRDALVRRLRGQVERSFRRARRAHAA
jgi:AcrR family transcriptional regulator